MKAKIIFMNYSYIILKMNNKEFFVFYSMKQLFLFLFYQL